MNRPYSERELAPKITNYITSKDSEFTYINEGVNGDRIAMIHERLPDILVNYNVSSNDIVLLFWDSDCSDVDESSMTNAEVAETRGNFTLNLQLTISLTLTRTNYMAVAGPELLGEGPIGYACVCKAFKNKTSMLNDYRSIVRNVTESFNLTYMDMRAEFLREVPIWWPICWGYVTIDGEHPNRRGTDVEARKFAGRLNEWFR